ncbi:MAG: 6-phosphogluconolactonase, partial [Flavihumibacter sp.]
FPSFEAVPVKAITLTIPALLIARRIFCVVPGARKAEAVYRTITDSVSPVIPATVLRTHNDAALYIDHASSSLLSVNH